MYKILHVDLETQNYPWYGQVASPFNPANYIVAPGWRVDTVHDNGTVEVGEVHWKYFTDAVTSNKDDWFTSLMADPHVTVMVCHNAQFELKWFLSRYRKALEDFLKRGGRVACTALGQYLVSHQQMLYPSLDETAVLYGGDHKVDGVKIMWEQGALTSEIDKDLLIQYLAGTKATTGFSGDIENTALCFYGQQAKLSEQGMSLMFWERCDSLLAFAYCEFFGLYVNQEVAHANLAEQEAEIANLQKQLKELLPKDLPDGVEFNWGSDYHMSALIYGGPVKYRHRVPYDPVQYVKADFYKVQGKEGTLIPVHDLVEGTDYNYERYKLGKNKGQIKIFREDTSEEKLKWKDTSVILPGLVKVTTLPAGVREKYVGRRAEYCGKRVLCDGVTPVYSTSTDALKGLKNFVPEVGLMVTLAGLEKDTSTYYWRAEYATEELARAASLPETVVAGEQGQSPPPRTQEEYETQVQSGMGGVGGNVSILQGALSDMQQANGNHAPCSIGDKSSARPLSCDGEDTRSAVSYVQQSSGDGGRQPRGVGTLRPIPQVGVNGCTKVKGMMQFIGPDSIVHHSLNVTATVTTRLSSSTPNLQNLPRDGTSRVKAMFTSRFGEDGRIVEVDYSALEVVMLCAMTGDTDLLALLQAGTDMHCYRLAFRLGEPYEDVMLKCHDETHPQHKEYKQMRTDIKPLSFADQYGATAGGIAFNTGCTVEFAQEFQENEAKLFPISRGYRQVIIDEVNETGSAPDCIHREMGDDGTWRVYRRGYYRGPSSTCYSFRQLPQWRDGREVMDYKATQMANYPFQGEAGFMMSSSMGRICRWLISKDWFDNQVCLINNVHDAAYLDAANPVVGREAALGVKAIMEDAPKYMTERWPDFRMADVPFPAAAEMGTSMFNKTHLE